MNNVNLIGRLTKDPDVRYTQGERPLAVARYNLAVGRAYKKEGEQTADFINCIAFGKAAEFTEKYLRKGTKVAITGRIQTGSYTNKDGNKVYTTDVVVERNEFCEGKNNNAAPAQNAQPSTNQSANTNSFMEVPDNMDELPFV